MGSPKLVPKYFNYHNFIRVMVLILALTIIYMPIMRDIFTEKFMSNHEWIAYLNVILIYCFNPKLFSPFVNLVLN